VQHVAVHSRISRLVAAVAVVVARANLLGLLAAAVLRTDPPVTPPTALRTFLFFTAGPALVAWLLARAGAGRARVREAALVLARRDLSVEVPIGSIARVAAWRVPLPGPGVSIVLLSGRRVRFPIRTDDPAALMDLVARAGGPASEARAASVLYASTRRRKSVLRLVLQFAVFGLVPGAIVFNLDQFIAYGGTFGQWYLEGPLAWLESFAIDWATVVVYLVCWANLWRIPAEAIVLLAAAVAPPTARGVRHAVEVVCGLAYWVGVPALMALRLLA
jgi:apolipoprotein N-acyltransferase